jgi:hypothetical protein
MQEGINTYTETIWAAINANHEKSMARMDAWLTNTSDNRRDEMEARLEEQEPASEDMTPEVADDQEVPVEDAEVRLVAEPRKRRRDGQNLAAVHRQKKPNRDLDARRRGKQQDLVAACRGTTRRAVVARRRVLLTKETRGYC